jgi:hypothetical protein
LPSAIITGIDRLAEIARRFVMQTEILGEAEIRQVGRGGRPTARRVHQFSIGRNEGESPGLRQILQPID